MTDALAAGARGTIRWPLGATLFAATFAVVTALWYVLLHPNGVLALYTPMYGFSLVAAWVAAIVLLARVFEGWPIPDAIGEVGRGIAATLLSVALAWGLVHGFFWGFLGQFGITYFSPASIVQAGGVGAEAFNARENASTAVVYALTAFLWIALVWSVAFGRWPWGGCSAGARAWSRLASTAVLAVLAYAILFHPHVTRLFYPAQTMAGVAPWWASFAQTGSAYFNLGWIMCSLCWVVISDVLWEGYPWRLVDRGEDGSLRRGAFMVAVTTGLGAATFLGLLWVMELVWFAPFEGGQYTDAPYFRYLHAAEIAGFVMLAALIVHTHFSRAAPAGGLPLRAALRTLAAILGGAGFYVFYYSPLATLLLGKVPGVAQPEDTSLVWTLLFAGAVLVQAEFFPAGRRRK